MLAPVTAALASVVIRGRRVGSRKSGVHTMNGSEGTFTTKPVRLERRSPSYWRVTFDIPPLNIFGPRQIPQLDEIISAIETDRHVKVVVFDSAVDGFFLAHYDFLAPLEDSTRIPPGRTGVQALPDMLARLSRAPVVSIASIRGRATGVGSELALASDMRFACREKAVLSQWEVGAGLAPGGGPMARLPRLIGRGRALEVLLVADDINAELAELDAMSIAPFLTLSLMVSSMDWRCGSLPSTSRRLPKPSVWSTPQAYRRIRRLARMGCIPRRPESPGERNAYQGADGSWLPSAW
jgi:Enoyl-CoA hydratase/isomerase